MRRIRIAALAGATAALATPALAAAHVSLHPNEVPAGSFATLDVRVPGEQSGAYADKVDTLLPPGFTEVNMQNVPGWTVKEITKNVSPPIQTDSGPVSQEISEVIWTGDRTPLGRIDNNYFVQFPLQLTIPDNLAGKSLAFKTLEYYSNGQVARWIGPPSADFPAPTINITAKGGVLQDVAGGEAGPVPGFVPTGAASSSPATTVTAPSGRASKGLAITALIVGVLGLLAGVGGLAAARRRG
jgi:uncharacterized protein